MWSQFIESLQRLIALMVNSLEACPVWPVLKHPLFIVTLVAMLLVLILRRAYRVVVLVLSGLGAVVVCQTTLMDVAVPDCFASKLPIFVFAFIIIAAINVYYLLIRD